MKKSQLLKSGLFATAAISAIASSIAPGFAIPYNGNTVYRVGSGSTATIYISATASSTIPVDIGYVSRVSSKLVGACGETVISGSTIGTTSSIKLNGSSIDLSTLPTQLLPACNSGTFAEARNANFKTPDGKVVLVGNTPGSSVTLDIPKATVKSVKINACGFGSFKGSDSAPLPSSFKISSTAYTTSSLPDAMNAPKCTSGIGYVPSSWVSGGSGT